MVFSSLFGFLAGALVFFGPAAQEQAKLPHGNLKFSEPEDSDFSVGDLVHFWTNIAEKEGCSHLAAGEEIVENNIVYPKVLEKKAYDARIKFVFVVGLEGSGHHFLGPMFKTVPHAKCLPVPTEANGMSSTLAWNNMKNGFFGSESTKEVVRERVVAYSTVLQQVYDQALLELGPDEHRTFIINTKCDMKVGELSYPNGQSYNKCHKTDFADVRVLGDVFENLGFDFRVLVLWRNAIDVLLSTAIHRDMGNWGRLAKEYTHIVDTYIIEQQLSRLDSSFFKCMNYDTLPKVSEGFGEFFGLDSLNTKFEIKNFRKTVVPQIRDRERVHYTQVDRTKDYKILEASLLNLYKLCEFETV